MTAALACGTQLLALRRAIRFFWRTYTCRQRCELVEMGGRVKSASESPVADPSIAAWGAVSCAGCRSTGAMGRASRPWC